MKKWLSVTLACFLTVGIATGCKKGETGSVVIDGSILDGYTPSGTLKVWSFTDELEKVGKKFTDKYPDVTIEYTKWDFNTLSQKLMPLLKSGSPAAPDIMGLSTSFATAYFNSDWLADVSFLNDSLNELEMPKGIQDFGRDKKGKLKGISYQCSVNGIFYRKDLAEKYLGTSDPAAIQTKMNSYSAWRETAAELRAASGGKCFLFPSIDTLVNSYVDSREKGWLTEDNRFQIADGFDELMNEIRFYRTEPKVDAELEGGSTNYDASIVDGLPGVEVFSYYQGTFFKEYKLKAQAKDEYEDYMDKFGVVEGMVSNCSGGTYTVMNAKAKNKQLAASFMKFIASDEQFYREWATQTGDIVASKKIVSEFAKDPTKTDANLGVNIYELFESKLDEVDLSIITQYDADIVNYLYDTANQYIMNPSMTAVQAREFFTKKVTDNIQAIKP